MVKLTKIEKSKLKESFENGDLLGLNDLYKLLLAEQEDSELMKLIKLIIDMNLRLYTVDTAMNKFTYSEEELYQSMLEALLKYVGIDMFPPNA